MSDLQTDPPPAPSPTILELFLGFMNIGISGFGGVLPFAHRTLVEDKRWLTEDEFAEVLALCQFLPGPNVVNVSVAVGRRFRGPLGALAAFVGIMGAPVMIAMVLGGLYQRYSHVPTVNAAIYAMAAAAAGLIASTAAKMTMPLFRPHARFGLIFVVAAFVMVGALRVPLVTALLILAPVSVALAAWRIR